MLLQILEVLLYVVFSLSSLLLIIVILLQEGKGGGLAAAFGGAGGDAFGVGSGGINRFTSILAGIFIGSAVVLAALGGGSVADPDIGKPDTEQLPPESDGSGETQPEDGGGEDPR